MLEKFPQVVSKSINQSINLSGVWGVWRFPVPSIVAVPRRGINWLCGELVSAQGSRSSKGVCAVQRGGRVAVTHRGALLRLVLQDSRRGDMQESQVSLISKTDCNVQCRS